MGYSSTEQINMSLYFIDLGKKGLKTKGMSGAKTRHQRWQMKWCQPQKLKYPTEIW